METSASPNLPPSSPPPSIFELLWCLLSCGLWAKRISLAETTPQEDPDSEYYWYMVGPDSSYGCQQTGNLHKKLSILVSKIKEDPRVRKEMKDLADKMLALSKKLEEVGDWGRKFGSLGTELEGMYREVHLLAGNENPIACREDPKQPPLHPYTIHQAIHQAIAAYGSPDSLDVKSYTETIIGAVARFFGDEYADFIAQSGPDFDIPFVNAFVRVLVAEPIDDFVSTHYPDDDSDDDSDNGG